MNRLLVAFSLSVSLPSAAFAAESASAVLTPSGSGPYQYSAVLNDTGTTTVGTFWFAWVPGKDFMTSSPTAITSPTGWQAIVTGGGGSDGFAIQWKASTAAADIPAAGSLSGFGFTSADSPSQLSGNSSFFPTTPTTTSVIYSGAPFSDGGFQFVASTAAAPEPASLGALGLGAIMLLRRRR